MSSKITWAFKSLLVDANGVLFDVGSGPIKRSIEGMKRLRRSKIPFRVITNWTQIKRLDIIATLNSAGFSFSESEIFSPTVPTISYLKRKNPRPHLLVTNDLLPEFSCCDQTHPNCVVVGDASKEFSYQNMNKAFQLLHRSEKPFLISMGKGKYHKENGEIVMDIGGFTAALEYAVGIKAKVIGKPSADFFFSALEDLVASPSETIMVGDDIISDVHGAQECGMKGVLVKTGKFGKKDLAHSVVKPDAVFDDFADFVDSLLEEKYHS